MLLYFLGGGEEVGEESEWELVVVAGKEEMAEVEYVGKTFDGD